MSFEHLADHDLRPWQLGLIKAVTTDGYRIIMVRGGKGSGKSVAAVYVAEAVALTRPGAIIGLVADTAKRLDDNLMPFCKAIFGSSGGVYWASLREFRWPNGSVVRMRMYYTSGSAGQNSTEGGGYTVWIFDEGQTLPPEILDNAIDRTRVWTPDLNGIPRTPVVIGIGIPCDPCWWVDAAEALIAEGGVPTAIFLPKSSDNAESYPPGFLEQQRALMGPERFAELYDNVPRPAVGSIYDCWVPSTGEGGNLVAGWQVEPDMRTALVVDPGKNKPAVLAVAEDHALRSWVIFDEWSPTQEDPPVKVDNAYELARHMLKRWWPKRWSKIRPRPELVGIDLVIGDPAAKVKGEADNLDFYQKLGLPPPGALQDRTRFGFGLPVIVNTDKDKQSVRAGIDRVRAAMLRAQQPASVTRSGVKVPYGLLMTQELWKRGQRVRKDKAGGAQAHTVARAIMAYAYGPGGDPIRGKGADDFADCVRYLTREFMWFEDGTEGRRPTHLVVHRQPRRYT